MWVRRQVTMRLRGQNGLAQRKKGKNSVGSVWMMKQVTMRMKGQDGLTEREED